jgi:hypothetical protein
VCVCEERGYGEGAGAHVTLLTDTRRRVVSLVENTGRIPGVEFQEPRWCRCYEGQRKNKFVIFEVYVFVYLQLD